MFGFVKMAALSAVLSYGVVTAYGPVPATGDATSGKPYQDRVQPAGEAAFSRVHGALGVDSVNS